MLFESEDYSEKGDNCTSSAPVCVELPVNGVFTEPSIVRTLEVEQRLSKPPIMFVQRPVALTQTSGLFALCQLC